MPTRLAVVPRLYAPPSPRAPSADDSGVFRLDAIATERCAVCALGAVLSGMCDRCGASVGVEVGS